MVLKWAKAEHDAPTDPSMLDDLKQAENAARERRLQPGELERLLAVAPAWLAPFITLAAESAIDGLRLHDIRASALSGYAEMGLTLPELRAIGGHKSMAILRYMRVGDVEALAQRLTSP